MKTAQIIRSHIQSMPPGQLFTPASFAGTGTRASIDQCLMRLTQAGSIERIGHGLYMTPKPSTFGLKALPSPEAVAQAVADSEGATIAPHGAEAARHFGFTTQTPIHPVFYTSGASREIKLGNLVIHLRHVASRKLTLAGRPAGQALSALWYLGKNEVTAQTFARIRSKLPPGEFAALEGAKSSMPTWMLDAFRQ
jgi:hypothetical protein